jgi:peptidoglycan/LPS O-acetylase OafA/YrhL
MDIDWLLNRFFEYSLYLGVPPLLIGLWHWKLLTWALRFFWFAVFSSLIISLIIAWLVDHHINNEFMSPIGTVLDTILMTFFFLSLNRFQPIRRAVLGLCGLILLLIAVSVWGWESTFQTSRFLSSIQSALIVMACLWLLYGLFKQDESQSLRREPLTWIGMGILISNALTVVLNIFGTILYTYSDPLFRQFWMVLVPLCLLIYYGFACIGFWVAQTHSLR